MIDFSKLLDIDGDGQPDISGVEQDIVPGSEKAQKPRTRYRSTAVKNKRHYLL
jgi:hypothetical protein